MSYAFDLLVIENHAALDRAGAETARVGGKLTAISQFDGDKQIQRVITERDGSDSSTGWIVLADHAAPLQDADFDALSASLAAVTGPIWLQPWNSRCRSGFYNWQAWSSQAACLWSNPSVSAAICLNLRGLQKPLAAQQPDLELDANASAWNVLQQLVIRGERVAFPTLKAVSSGLEPLDHSAVDHSQLPRLTPTSEDVEAAWLRQRILSLKPSQLVVGKRSDADCVAVKAGLFQWHGWLDDSHQLSQSIEGLGKHHCGDYWHAINHRREPDYSNARYWFRQLGSHSVFSQLTPFVAIAFEPLLTKGNWPQRLIKSGTWDPFAFVDLCEACEGDDDEPLAIVARQLQAIEMQLLMTATYRDAAGIGL